VVPRTGVHGVVVDQKGNPIARSVIDIGTPDATQSVVQTHGDANGNFELFGLTSGNYTITAKTFDGRASKLTNFSLDDDSLADMKLVVEGQPVLSGRVIANGNPVSGATLTFIPTDANVVFLPTGRSDANGEFAVRLPPGASTGNLIVATAGFPFKMFHLTIPDQSIVIDVDAIGATLDADVLPFVSDENAPQTFVVHRGADVNAQFLASATGVRITAGSAGHVHIVHPLMEPGEYSLCAAYMRELPALRSGLLPKECCSTGVLAPYGSLKLAVPSLTK
jgi:Carboxypeptidase regulatory-like domain